MDDAHCGRFQVMTRVLATILLTACIIVLPAHGQSDASPQDSAAPQTIRLRLAPAEFRRPALVHHLLPEILEQTPGNAATGYLLALASFDSNDKSLEPIDAWLRASLNQMPQQARGLGERFSRPLKLAHVAARREQCTW